MKRFLLFLAIPLLFMSNASLDTPADAAKPTIIFVHGLWADGSSWNKVIAPLQREGYEVFSVQNPTTSLADDVAATKRVIERASGPVVLVGHSWGGVVITEAGADPRVKALVYVAAYLPDVDEGIAALGSKAPETQLQSYLQQVGGVLTLSKEGVQKAFANDLPEAEQNIVYATQTPASPTVFGDKVTNASWKQKPHWYILSKNDKAINPELQRIMSKRAEAKTTELDASHVPMLSKPNEVLKVVKEAADSVK